MIVVSYRTRALTLRALASIADGARRTRVEIIVVDNASDDGSADAISAAYPEATLIRLGENVGFAAAHAVAERHARAPRLLLLNPDAEAHSGAIDALRRAMEADPAARIVGGRTVFADGALNPGSCWRALSTWTLAMRATGLAALAPHSPLFNPEGYGGWDRRSARRVDIVSGCFLMIDAALWRALGGFDLSYVMYGEDADLCARARAAGARPRLVPEAVALHHGGASEPARAAKMIRLLKAKARLIRRSAAPAPARALNLALLAAWPLSRALAFGLLARGFGARREEAAIWAEIARRRGEWLPGWPDASRAPPHDAILSIEGGATAARAIAS